MENTVQIELTEALELPAEYGDPSKGSRRLKKGDRVSLPRAKALILVGMKKARLAPIAVRFVKSYSGYNPGELAGFAPELAQHLVKTGTATYEADFQERDVEKSRTDAVDITALPWSEAVAVVDGVKTTDRLEELLKAETARAGGARKSVQEAIVKRLKHLDKATP